MNFHSIQVFSKSKQIISYTNYRYNFINENNFSDNIGDVERRIPHHPVSILAKRLANRIKSACTTSLYSDTLYITLKKFQSERIIFKVFFYFFFSFMLRTFRYICDVHVSLVIYGPVFQLYLTDSLYDLTASSNIIFRLGCLWSPI